MSFSFKKLRKILSSQIQIYSYINQQNILHQNFLLKKYAIMYNNAIIKVCSLSGCERPIYSVFCKMHLFILVNSSAFFNSDHYNKPILIMTPKIK